MLLVDLIPKKGLVVPLEATTLRPAFESLLAGLSGPERPTDILDALLKREEQAPTLLAPGLAFPHCRWPEMRDTYLALGISRRGIPLGGGLAKLLFLVVTAPEKNSLILQIRAALAKALLDDPGLQARLEGALSPHEVRDALGRVSVKVQERVSVADLMIKPPPKVRLGAKVGEVLDLLKQFNLTEIPVVDANDRLIGSIGIDEITALGTPPYFDLMGDMSFLDNFEPFVDVFKKEHTESIDAIYNRQTSTAPPEAHVVTLAQLFRKNRVRYVFVISADRKLLGLVTRRQLLHGVLRP